MCQSRRIWGFSLGALLALSLTLALSPPARSAPSPPDSQPPAENVALTSLPQAAAAAALVLEAHSGELLFAVNAHQPLPPASTAKILTALLTLDMADIGQTTVISPQAAAVPEMSIYLRAGEELTLADLLRGALAHSGNDACFALAEAVAGSEPLFVHWLNLKAAVLGAYSANYRNTNGLPAEGQVISGADLAKIAACAMEREFFAATVGSKQVRLGQGASARSYQNTNKLLWQDQHIVGVKTGTTDAAGPCLVAAYADGAALYISVVLDSPDRYGESLRLLHWAAESYILLRPVSLGQALACYQGQLLYAGAEASFLLGEEQARQVRVRWELPHRLLFLDAEGDLLAQVPLCREKPYSAE